MGSTHKSDSHSGPGYFGNGSAVLSPTFPLLDMGKFSRTSDFTIHPPNVKIDAALMTIVEKECEKLRLKRLKNLKDESDWNLTNVLKLPDSIKDTAKARLLRDGKSAVISEVSKSLNMSSLDHSSKYLLSNEPLYVYALSYTIYKEEVEDSEGLNDRIIAAVETKIKPYFNALLVKKIVKDQHLNLSDEQKKKILQAARTTNISYLQGEPLKAINKIISKYVEYGDMNILVDKFFESGKIDPSKGTPQVRQLMVKYLINIGLTVSPADLQNATSSSSSATSGSAARPGTSAGAGRTTAGSENPTGSANEPLRSAGPPQTPTAKELAEQLAKIGHGGEKEHGKESPGKTESTELTGKSPKNIK